MPVGTGGVCEGTGGVGTMGGGVCECECMPPCAAAISAMSCADWSPAAQPRLSQTAFSSASPSQVPRPTLLKLWNSCPNGWYAVSQALT